MSAWTFASRPARRFFILSALASVISAIGPSSLSRQFSAQSLIPTEAGCAGEVRRRLLEQGRPTPMPRLQCPWEAGKKGEQRPMPDTAEEIPVTESFWGVGNPLGLDRLPHVVLHPGGG